MKIRRKSHEPRDTGQTIRLSKKEQQELKRRAKAEGKAVGAYLIELALGNTKEGEHNGQNK